MTKSVLTFVLALACVPPARAQAAPSAGAPLPSFEVVSIKPNRSRKDDWYTVQPNRLTVRNLPAKFLIKFAYGRDFGQFGFEILRDNELVGGPVWIWTETYDVDAQVDGSLADNFRKADCFSFFRGACAYRQQFLLMVQGLLADRFKLTARWERKEGPAYVLVVAKGGPKFSHTTYELGDPEARGQNITVAPLHRVPCPAGMACFQVHTSMRRLADYLSLIPQVGRPVIDQTGLEGGFDFLLQWAREQSPKQMFAEPEKGGAAMDTPLPSDPSGPSIFTALQEQLGLKLEARRGPVEFLAIDHIERPSEN